MPVLTICPRDEADDQLGMQRRVSLRVIVAFRSPKSFHEAWTNKKSGDVDGQEISVTHNHKASLDVPQ